MKVININERSATKHKEDLLQVLDELRRQIEEGEIEEFVAASSNAEGEVQIHVCSKDLLGSIGMFEVGKYTLMQIQQQ